jgi:hypothetical protein
MNASSPFVRKIIYIALIGILLIPLSLVSRPETRNETGNIEDAGGQLSQLREDYSLSQAKLSEIDPASETMKLASLGLRGVAVNILWMQAMEHKEKESYEKLASTLKALTKIQPNFVKVWEFQAHNLAYNVSMEFDDYEYRYQWVKKGLGFLKQGVPYNKTDHRMTDNLGLFTGQKMGKSDEKDSFRRMFRQDDEFHQEMSDMIDPDTYNTRNYGYDSWKMAYQWYDYSRKMVEEQSYRQRTSDMMFFSKRPAQLRNQGMSLQREYRTDEIIQEIWAQAHDEWLEYGQMPISNTLGITITMEGMEKNLAELENYRRQLDELVPGVRKDLSNELLEQADIPPEAMAAWNVPFDDRTDEEIQLARKVNITLDSMDGNLDGRIASQAKPEDRIKANRLVSDIRNELREINTIDKDSGTVNYTFWKARTGAEASDIAARARQALYDAQEMRRKSIYDDEFDRDYKTKEVTITKRGAISLYEQTFERWAETLEMFPRLKDGPLGDELVRHMKDYQEMLTLTNREWPENHPLQALIDKRAAEGELDELPTTEELEEMRTALADEREAIKDAQRTERQRPPGLLLPDQRDQPIDPKSLGIDPGAGGANSVEKLMPPAVKKQDSKDENKKSGDAQTKKESSTESGKSGNDGNSAAESKAGPETKRKKEAEKDN